MLQISIAPAMLRLLAAHAELDPQRVALPVQLGLNDPLIYALGTALHRDQVQASGLGALYRETLAQALVAHVLQQYAHLPQPAPQRTAGLDGNRLQSVLDYIAAHLDADLSLAELARVANVSPYYFARSFKQATGQPPHQYVIAQRIAAAQRLLAQGSSVGEVAAQVGFADQSHLTRQFKRLVGTTPRAFQQQRKKIQFLGKDVQA